MSILVHELLQSAVLVLTTRDQNMHFLKSRGIETDIMKVQDQNKPFERLRTKIEKVHSSGSKRYFNLFKTHISIKY